MDGHSTPTPGAHRGTGGSLSGKLTCPFGQAGEFGDKQIQGSCEKLQDVSVSDLNVDFSPFLCHMAKPYLLAH